MSAYEAYTTDKIDIGQFKVEDEQVIGNPFDLLSYEELKCLQRGVY